MFAFDEYGYFIPISRRALSAAFKGVDHHYTSESFVGPKSLSLLASRTPKHFNVANVYMPDAPVFVSEHPGLAHDVIAWGTHEETRKLKRQQGVTRSGRRYGKGRKKRKKNGRQGGHK